MPSKKIILIHRLTGLLQLVLTECFRAARTVPGAGRVVASVAREHSSGRFQGVICVESGRGRPGRRRGGRSAQRRCAAPAQRPAVLWAAPRRMQGAGGSTAEGRPATSFLFTQLSLWLCLGAFPPSFSYTAVRMGPGYFYFLEILELKNKYLSFLTFALAIVLTYKTPPKTLQSQHTPSASIL